MFTYTTDGIVVENFILYNIMYEIQFALFCFILFIVMMLLYSWCYMYYILFHFISLCLLNYTLMLWVIMFWGHMVYLTSYVLADGIAKIYFYYVNVTDVIIMWVRCY